MGGYSGQGSSYSLILVLFVLLAIVGCTCYTGWGR